MTLEDIEHEIENVLSIDAEQEQTLDEDAINAYLEELATAEADKIDGFCRFLRIKAASAEAKKAEAKRLLASAQSEENSVSYLKMKYLQVMQTHGLQKVKGAAYKLSIRATPVVQIEDMAALPKEYLVEKVTTTPDKLRLRDDLKSGMTIPGAKLGQNFSLQVA